MNTKRRLLAITAILTLTLIALASSFGERVFAKGKGSGQPGGGNDGGNTVTNSAFAYEEASSLAIFVTSIDGTEVQALTSPKRGAADKSPTWSPDLDPDTDGYQGKIAYLHRPDNTLIWSELYLINPDGSDRQLVRSFDRSPVPDDFDPSRDTLAWTPNGKEIVFSSRGSGFHAVEVATGNLRLLFERPFPVDGDMRGPSLSPLGMLAFDVDGDIYVIDFQFDDDGLIEIDPVSVENLTAGSVGLFNEHASWSPDGTYLSYVRGVVSLDGILEQLVVRDMLLGDLIVVLEVEDLPELEAAWSPDGSQIGVHLRTTFKKSGSWDIFRITNWADSDNRLVTPVTSPDRSLELRPSWNPGWSDS